MHTAAPPTRPRVATEIALVASFAALVAACAQLTLPLVGIPVPVTLQTFGVALAGAVLGARRGALAVGLYLVVGLAGAPVFAQFGGGLGVVGRPSFGYLAAFPLAAFVTGYFCEAMAGRPRWWRGWRADVAVFAATTAGTLLVVHPIGIVVLAQRAGLTFPEALAIDLVFVPGDLVKNALAAVVATAVHRAFPDLLRRR